VYHRTHTTYSLQLKSSQIAGDDAAAHAVLCTPDKTFGIRQKNSSNTVYILQPGQDGTSPGGAVTAPELIGISKRESTLETLPAPTTKASTYIRQLLPILSTNGTISGQKQPMTKSQLLANIPLSDAECEVALREQSVFTDHTTNHCLNPTAGLKINAWHSMLENARANAVDLTSELDEDAVLSLKDGLEDLKPGLFEAIIHSVATTKNGQTSIDADLLVRWIGLNRLAADAPVQVISTSEFKTSWKDELPEKLRDRVDLALISDHAELRGNKWVKLKDDFSELVTGTKGANAPAAAGSKRKWHEKFKPAKKAT
jgi:sister chromatid cohesion protein DCC1